jgi:DHA2 family multidrug resistance protein
LASKNLSRRGIVTTLVIGTMMAALDSSIVNVSLPTMMRSLHSEIDEIEWVISVYMIGFAVIMPLTQWLKERVGFFTLYLGSLLTFTIGSALCGLAHNLPLLISARVIQALGGGALTPTAMAVLATIYEPRERGRVIGLWGLGVILGPALGPTLGGLLTENFGWPSIFLVNIPIGFIGLIMTWIYLRPLKHQRGPNDSFDFKGFGSISIFLVSLLYGISQLERKGLTSLENIIYFVLAFVMFWIFLRQEKKTKSPLIDLKIFKNKTVVACLLVTFARSAALFGGVFLLPFLLQSLMGLSETRSGMVMFPGAIFIGILMPLAGRWADKYGPRGISITGLILITTSMLLFARLGSHSSTMAVLVAMSLRGIGLGLLITPLSLALVNSVSHREVALVSSLSSLMQQIGGAMGVASLAVLHQFLKNHLLKNGASIIIAEQSAVHTGFIVASILTGIALIPAMYVPLRTYPADPKDLVAAETI